MVKSAYGPRVSDLPKRYALKAHGIDLGHVHCRDSVQSQQKRPVRSLSDGVSFLSSGIASDVTFDMSSDVSSKTCISPQLEVSVLCSRDD